VKAPLRSLQLRHDARRVIRPQLLVAHAPRPRPHRVGCSLETHGFEAGRVVRPHGAGNHEQQRAPWRTDAQGALRADQRGAEIQRVAPSGGDEPLLHGREARNQLDESLPVADSRQADARGAVVQARHVLGGAEEGDGAVAVLVGFQAFEAFEGVVEDAGGRVEGEVLVGEDAWGVPAGGGGPFEGEHVVGEVAAED